MRGPRKSISMSRLWCKVYTTQRNVFYNRLVDVFMSTQSLQQKEGKIIIKSWKKFLNLNSVHTPLGLGFSLNYSTYFQGFGLSVQKFFSQSFCTATSSRGSRWRLFFWNFLSTVFENLRKSRMWSNSDSRQVNFNRTKIGGNCQNWKIEMRHF